MHILATTSGTWSISQKETSYHLTRQYSSENTPTINCPHLSIICSAQFRTKGPGGQGMMIITSTHHHYHMLTFITSQLPNWSTIGTIYLCLWNLSLTCPISGLISNNTLSQNMKQIVSMSTAILAITTTNYSASLQSLSNTTVASLHS